MATQETKSVSEEHLQQVRELQTAYASVTAKLGHTEVERILTRRRLQELDSVHSALVAEYESLEQRELEIINTFNEIYGEGALNIDTGEFTIIKN